MSTNTVRRRIAVSCGSLAVLLYAAIGYAQSESAPQAPPDAAHVTWTWGVRIPMRDGIALNATVYRPKDQKAPAPCIFSLTPYISQNYHDRGIYFAARGYPFLIVDERGRGNSEGQFRAQTDARDGFDVVEWLARQPYCNGKVAMWGGSYAGNNQWVTASAAPPQLATIVPAASDQPGVDWPMRNNIAYPYIIQWLTLTSGRASQEAIFGDKAFWAARYREWFESGRPFRELDRIVGNPSPQFQEWVSKATQGSYYDALNPNPEQYARLKLPILTITGSYDADQPGALAFYKQHMQHGNPEATANHYLIIGPWDHAGTRTPRAEFGGLKFGPASLVDLPKLHTQWYAWTLQSGPRPEFLRKRVAYYVTGAEKWRYADTLEGVTSEARAYYLDSDGGSANDVFASGDLVVDRPGKGRPDRYVYDPRDVSLAALEAEVDVESLTDQRMVLAARGKHLVYHSAPFERDTEISGFFRLSAWIALDQPDTDFMAQVYEVLPDGNAIPLSSDVLRARYRESLRQARLPAKNAVLRYDFERFTFVSRLVKKGSRLRLVVGPINSIYFQKNYNSGGVVAEESIEDARTVTVTLHHGRARASALYVPVGQPDGEDPASPSP
ncbi:MAG: CocE/NonD family hydrolase [Steroidobacteraceae bacterium]